MSAWQNSTFFEEKKNPLLHFKLPCFWSLVQFASLNCGSMNLCLAYEHISEKESMTTKLYGHTASKILDIFYTDFFL